VEKLKPEALILTGYGINCDYETQYACHIAGFSAKRVHLNDLLEKSSDIFKYKLVVFPGGFSFGDDLGSGVAFASKIRFSLSHNKERLYDTIMEYVYRGGLILGVCNGFQILVRLGIIPALDRMYGVQQVTLAPNREGYFIDRWVNLKVEKDSKNVFTKGMDLLRLPVRHGEGRFIPMDQNIMHRLDRDKQISLRYCDENGKHTMEFPFNPNGSEAGIAGISDPSGRILGLMPHPEAAISIYQYPDWTGKRQPEEKNGISLKGDGYLIFKNAYLYVTG